MSSASSLHNSLYDAKEKRCCRPLFATPLAYIPPLSAGINYEFPVPSYPIIRSSEQVYTARPSYLNTIANDWGHPLNFMAFNNTQRD